MQQDNLLVSLYHSMLRIRRIEEYLSDQYQEDKLSSPLHLCIGQEAIPAGVCLQLERKDKVFSGHRYHGHYLAKGGDLKKLIGAIYHRRCGSYTGLGGSLYARDRDAGFWASSPVIAGSVPLAVGAAWANKQLKQRQVTVVFFGDAALEQGILHESLNFAVLHKLAIVFVCENNGYAAYAPLRERQANQGPQALINAHGIASISGDGNDVLGVYNMARHAIESARNGMGPQFLHFETHRWREHCGPHFDDDLGYRSMGELDEWLGRCPINLAKLQLHNHNLMAEEQTEMFEKDIRREFEQAFKAVMDSPYAFEHDQVSVPYVA